MKISLALTSAVTFGAQNSWKSFTSVARDILMKRWPSLTSAFLSIAYDKASPEEFSNKINQSLINSVRSEQDKVDEEFLNQQEVELIKHENLLESLLAILLSTKNRLDRKKNDPSMPY